MSPAVIIAIMIAMGAQVVPGSGEETNMALVLIGTIAMIALAPVPGIVLAARVKRTAYAEDAKLEVILRVTEEGERYLFVLNPDPDERASDRVLLDFPVSAAVDVSVEGGYPVKVASEGERSSIAMTLGPCETAVLYLTSE